MSKASRVLLEFAIRLYTRLHPREGLMFGAAGFSTAKPEVLHLDNGKRMVKVSIFYGPYWSEE